MNGFDACKESPKRRREEKGPTYSATTSANFSATETDAAVVAAEPSISRNQLLLGFWPPDEQLEKACSAVVPPVTVAIEGRAICCRIHLHRHGSYESLALALHHMFVDGVGDDDDDVGVMGSGVNLSNAVPGHIVAYEDMEDDLLLAGDLDWKDFVRVVKRIRIIPAKASCRKQEQYY